MSLLNKNVPLWKAKNNYPCNRKIKVLELSVSVRRTWLSCWTVHMLFSASWSVFLASCEEPVYMMTSCVPRVPNSISMPLVLGLAQSCKRYSNVHGKFSAWIVCLLLSQPVALAVMASQDHPNPDLFFISEVLIYSFFLKIPYWHIVYHTKNLTLIKFCIYKSCLALRTENKILCSGCSSFE